MMSLGNSFKAAGNNRPCEGVRPGTGGGRRRGAARRFSVWPCEIVKIETHDTRAVGAVETRTTYFFWVLFLNALKAHSLHTDKPSQMVSGSKEQVHVTKWEGTQRSCGGGGKEWFGCRSSQSAADWSFTQAGGAYNWLFVAVRGMNMCVCLCLPLPTRDSTQTLTPWAHVCVFFVVVVIA